MTSNYNMKRNQEKKVEVQPEPENETKSVPTPILNRFDTLVRYDAPFVATINPKKKSVPVDYSRYSLRFNVTEEYDQTEEFSTGCKKHFETVNMSRQETQGLLNIIIPPRSWMDDGVEWTQTASTVPATKSDVIKLSEMLDQRLKEGHAREIGIDYYRRELYTQLFDELIRQSTLQCYEQGLFLLRIRNEIQMTFRAYENLHSSASAYGIRKVLQAQEDRDDITRLTGDDRYEIEDLKKMVAQLQEQLDGVHEGYAILREELQAQREDEMDERRREVDTTKMQVWAAVFPKNIAVPGK